MVNAAAAPKPPQMKKKKGSTPFLGVRKRAWGRFGAEITIPGERRRVWLGTFNTAEAAAKAYDRAARSYGIPEAKMNFPATSPEIIEID